MSVGKLAPGAIRALTWSSGQMGQGCSVFARGLRPSPPKKMKKKEGGKDLTRHVEVVAEFGFVEPAWPFFGLERASCQGLRRVKG